MHKEYKNYLIFDDGRIFSLKNKIFLKPFDRPYQRVHLNINGAKERWSVHRLIMFVFVGPSKLTVNHKNGIKTDNRLENLEYLTLKENIRHAIANGLTFHKALSREDVNFILTSKNSYKSLAKKFKVSTSTIYKIKNDLGVINKRKKANSFFDYEEFLNND